MRFDDLMGAARFDRDRHDLDARGLYLDMPAWGYHVFDVTALDEAHADGGLPTELASDLSRYVNIERQSLVEGPHMARDSCKCVLMCGVIRCSAR